MKKITLSLFFSFIVGAFAHAQTIYVNAAASGANNGTSWVNAYTQLQTAIAAASSGEIWVAAGTYRPGVSGSNSATYTMKNNVSIFGGFNGTETLLSQRNHFSNITILSGDLDVSGTPTSSDAYHVVTTGNTNSSAVLDGFVITRGNAFGGGATAVGGGIYYSPSVSGFYGPVIRNCDINNNKANSKGAGLYMDCSVTGPSTSGLTLDNCRFHANTSLGYGGAIYMSASGSTTFTTPNILNCLFYNNSAASSGNYIAAESFASGEVHAQVTNCTFGNNATGAELAFMSNGSNNTFYINNSLLFGLDLYTDGVLYEANDNFIDLTFVTGSNNVNTDPLYVNAGAFDYHLTCASPAINAGNNASAPGFPDLDGNPRIAGAIVDLGVFEKALPVVVANAAPGTSLCNGDMLTLTGSGAVSYAWSNGVTDGVALFTSPSLITYTVTGTDAAGCQNTATVSIAVNSLPTVVANATQSTICTGDFTTLSGSGADTYVWTGGVTDGMSFNPTITNTYTVTGTDLNGCVNTSTLTIAVNPLPNVVANASSPGVCEGGSVTFNGTGAVSYVWDNGVGDNIPYVPVASNTYNVIGTDANGCSNTSSIVVAMENISGVTAGGDVNLCRTIQMFTLSGNSAGNSFSWTTLGTGYFVNELTQTPDYYFSSADSLADSVAIVFNVVHTYCANQTDTMFVHLINPAFSYAGGDLNGCANESTGITVNGTALGASSVAWTSTNGGVFSSPSTAFSFYDASAAEVAMGLAELIFTVNPLNIVCPVPATDTMKIILHTPPTFSLGSDYSICETDSILLQTSISGGSPPFLYNWGNGLGTISTANNEMYLPLATENINLYASDLYGCYGKDTVLVTVDASETLTINMHVGAGVLTDGTMYVLKFIPQQMAFDTMFPYPFSGGTGTIQFNLFPFGNYLIKVVPDTNLYPNLLPTYYGDAFQWDSATVINHSCVNPFIADINMIALLGGTGSGSVSGYILEEQGFGSRYGAPHNHIMVPGGPLKGIDVKLGKNPAGGIQARTVSDSLGFYSFTNIPDDSYRIYVDIPGLPMDSFYVVNVQADSSINLNYYADSNSVFPVLPTAVGFNKHTFAAEGIALFPNPAKNHTSLRFESASQHTASIRVLDVTGKILQQIQLTNLPKGKHEYQLNFENGKLSSGIYFIEVQTDAGMQTKKLIIE